MEKAATDIYTFENLRRNGFTYIDKTAILKQLADMSRGKQFFIARPRRFGKSLAVSTLQCLFEGRRDLFQGLAIETATDAYVIEVKRDSTPMKAIEQIRDKSYTDKFRLAGKPITLIGIAFSTKKRAVSGAKIVREA